MVAELASPEELERHFCCTARITYATGLCCPVAAFIKVKTCIGIDEILTEKDTILRKNVCVLDSMLIGDTTATLIELVVPRNGTTGNKSLCHESEILLKGTVGEYACNGILLIT